MRSTGEILGLVLMVVGVLVLLGTLGADSGLSQALGWIWPLLIVGFGLWLVWDASNRRRAAPRAGWGPPGVGQAAPGGPAGPAGPTGASESAASGWSSGAWSSAGTSQDPWRARVSHSWGAPGWAWAPGALRDHRFLGEIEMAGPIQAGPMDIETFIGEVRLDLTRATFPEGETPIHVSAAIGEVRVLLPADIPASVRTSSLLGESEALGRVSGAFMGDARAETEDFAGATRRIRLEAQSLIGEVAVRRARADGFGPAPASAPAWQPEPDAPASQPPPDAPVWRPEWEGTASQPPPDATASQPVPDAPAWQPEWDGTPWQPAPWQPAPDAAASQPGSADATDPRGPGEPPHPANSAGSAS